MTEERAELSAADINDLPDIEPGGEKDDQRSDSQEIELREEGESSATTLTNTVAGDVLTPITVRRRRGPRHRTVPMAPEVRHWSIGDRLEVRSATDGRDEIVISGTPIVYNQPYVVTDLLGEFEERMLPGVARNVIRSDVRFLFNHDGMPLARTTSGTLQLEDGEDELRFVARLDARQQLSNDLAIAIERGDISQMSVGFIPAQDEWNDAMDQRSVKLFAEMPDISAVTYPASPTTNIQVAQRMVSEVPVESRARLRKIYTEVRAGKVLSKSNEDYLVAAATALHQVLDPVLSRQNEDVEEQEPQERAEQETSEERSEFAQQAEETAEDDGREARANVRRLRIELERDLLRLRKAA